MKFKKKIILTKIEATYGQDAAPTGALNAVQAFDVSIKPIEAQNIDREITTETLGSSPTMLVGLHQSVEFSVELAGSGAAGTVPGYSDCLRACALAETINAGDVQYDPVSENAESATLYFHIDGNLHKLLGARGSVAFEISTQNRPMMKFKFIGLWVDPVAAAMPSGDFSKFIQPLPVSAANTPTFTIHGHSPKMQSLSIDLGVSNVHRDLVNGASILMTDRASKGSVVIESPVISVKDFFAMAKAATLDALQLVHGTTAGNICQIDCPKVQIMPPDYSDSDGVAMLSMDLNICRDTGDDEFKLTVK